MNCHLCHRPIKAGQPIWASYSGINEGYIYCQKCWEKEAKHDYWWADCWVKDLQCLCCGRTIHTRTSRDRITCSPECQLEFRRKRNRENLRAKRFSVERPDGYKACEYCYFPTSHYSRSDRRYCSARCRQAAYRERSLPPLKRKLAAEQRLWNCQRAKALMPELFASDETPTNVTKRPA
jgi:hypothetical protein